MNKDGREAAFYVRAAGRVQGVGFRFSAIREAHRLGVTGWVRNAANGDVEVFAEGSRDKLDAFVEWLRVGPRFSRVDSLDIQEKPLKGYRDFNVEY